MAQTLAEVNRDAWNNHAESYDDEPWKQRIATQLKSALDEHSDWIGARWANSNNAECSLLDYACGTGAMTRAFQQRITKARGIDVSDKMVAIYNKRMSQDGFDKRQVTAVVGDLIGSNPAPPLGQDDFRNFDLAVVGLGFHHFDSPESCLRQLAERLKPETGVCLIVDWEPLAEGEAGAGHHHHHHAHHKHGHGHRDGGHAERAPHGSPSSQVSETWNQMQPTIKHDGFTESDMRSLFEQAGFMDFQYVVLAEPFVLEMRGITVKRKGFLARGRRR